MPNNGKKVLFVGEPENARPSSDWVFARPDDPSPYGGTWRDHLVLNNVNSLNRSGLLPAVELYKKDIYAKLVARFGQAKVYIMSAGWGLVRGDFPLPYYDITFAKMNKNQSKEKNIYKFRQPKDIFHDFCHLSMKLSEQLIFFGSPVYLRHFVKLTSMYQGERVVFHGTVAPPRLAGCSWRPHKIRDRYQWPYECAEDFLLTH